MAEPVLDVVAEDPEVDHVADRCIQPPCRNMDVSIGPKRSSQAAGSAWASRKYRAGTNPQVSINASTAGPSETSNRNTHTLTAIRAHVTPRASSGSERSHAAGSCAPLDDDVGGRPTAVDEQRPGPHRPPARPRGRIARGAHRPPVHLLDDVTGADARLGGGPTRQHLDDHDALQRRRQAQLGARVRRHVLTDTPGRAGRLRDGAAVATGSARSGASPTLTSDRLFAPFAQERQLHLRARRRASDRLRK